jgi:hypothetical protein
MSTKNGESKISTNQKIRFTPNVKHNTNTFFSTDKNSKQNNLKNLVDKDKSKVS